MVSNPDANVFGNPNIEGLRVHKRRWMTPGDHSVSRRDRMPGPNQV